MSITHLSGFEQQNGTDVRWKGLRKIAQYHPRDTARNDAAVHSKTFSSSVPSTSKEEEEEKKS